MDYHIDKKHNLVAYLVETGEYKDIMRWLKHSKIHYAISCNIPIYYNQVSDFWSSATVVSQKNVEFISATVQGKKMVVNVDTVNSALKLQDDMTHSGMSKEEDIINGFKKMGFEGHFSGRKEVMKNLLPHEWKFLCHVFIHCISHRKGGYDGLTLEWARAMWRICDKKRYCLSKQIFYYLKQNASMSAAKWMLYPRFVQMIINYVLKDLSPDENLIQLTEMGKRTLSECSKNKGHSGRWTPLFKHMYPAQRYEVIRKLHAESEKKWKEKHEGNQTAEELEENEEEYEVAKKRKEDKGKQKVADVFMPPKKIVAITPDSLIRSTTESEMRGIQREDRTATFSSVVEDPEEMELVTYLQEIYDLKNREARSKRPAETEAKPSRPSKRKRPLHADMIDMLKKEIDEKTTKEFINLKLQVQDSQKLKEKIKSQKKKIVSQQTTINNQSAYMFFQYEVISKLVETIQDLHAHLDLDCPVNMEDLDFIKWKEGYDKRRAAVMGARSSGTTCANEAGKDEGNAEDKDVGGNGVGVGTLGGDGGDHGEGGASASGLNQDECGNVDMIDRDVEAGENNDSGDGK